MTKNIPELFTLPTRTAPAPTPASPATTKTIPSKPIDYAQPFCDFLSNNPTVFHAVSFFADQLSSAGFKKLSERDAWDVKTAGKYFVTRNGSSLIAFIVGKDYKPSNGVAIVAGHVDALTVRLKPIPTLQTREGFVQIGVAPYAGGLNSTWWDRDLGVAGRVIVRDDAGKVHTKLVDLHRPIARIPTLAPHFGAVANGPFNLETQMVPIVGIDNSDIQGGTVLTEKELEAKKAGSSVGPPSAFTSSQPPQLVKAIAKELGVSSHKDIVNWELELYDSQPAQLGGLDKELIYGGRLDDKLCSWAAIQGLLESSSDQSPGIVKCVGVFDDEEIGSLLKQGARSNFMRATLERIIESIHASSNRTGPSGSSLVSQTLANSFLVSSDVTHAVNPNFLNAYLPNHMPRLNVGVTVSYDADGHVTTDAVSMAVIQRVAEKSGSTLQVFQIRNDTRSGGTIGPMMSSNLGVRAVDCGIPQLSMHSIRATTGALDPGLGVQLFRGVFDHYEAVDAEFRET